MKKFTLRLKGLVKTSNPPPGPVAGGKEQEDRMSESDTSHHRLAASPVCPVDGEVVADAAVGGSCSAASSAQQRQEPHQGVSDSMDTDTIPPLPTAMSRKRVPIMNNPEGAAALQQYSSISQYYSTQVQFFTIIGVPVRLCQVQLTLLIVRRAPEISCAEFFLSLLRGASCSFY